MKATHFFLNFFEGFLDFYWFSGIKLIKTMAMAYLFKFSEGFKGFFFIRLISYGNFGARSCKPQSDASSNATTGAGDNNGFVSEIKNTHGVRSFMVFLRFSSVS